MSISRSPFTIGLAIVVALGGCQDAGQGPLAPATTGVREITGTPKLLVGRGVPVLRQSAAAPALETYTVSFWVVRGRETDIRVNYLPVGNHKPKHFLRFRIPKKQALEYDASSLQDASSLEVETADSVYMTLTIDPVAFDVHFETTGVGIELGLPAELTLWYSNANRDLNSDGVVDGVDRELMDALALYSIAPDMDTRLGTTQDKTTQSLSVILRQYSQYAVSW